MGQEQVLEPKNKEKSVRGKITPEIVSAKRRTSRGVSGLSGAELYISSSFFSFVSSFRSLTLTGFCHSRDPALWA